MLTEDVCLLERLLKPSTKNNNGDDKANKKSEIQEIV